MQLTLWLINCFLLCCWQLRPTLSAEVASKEYLNEWLVEVPGGLEQAQIVAKDHGYQFVKELTSLPKVFVFRRTAPGSRVKRETPFLSRLFRDDRITWVEQQAVYVREKRDFIDVRTELADDAFFETDLSGPRPRAASSLPGLFSQNPNIHVFLDGQDESFSSEENTYFNDPLWTTQWYLLDSSNSPGVRTMRAIDSRTSISLNVFPAWRAGYTGKNVVVTILDDGLETTHSDLEHNYLRKHAEQPAAEEIINSKTADHKQTLLTTVPNIKDPEASTNINGNNRDPTPRYENPEDTHHGTRCAGEVAMQANNRVCGVGIAYNARIGGVRMLDGSVTDRVEAEAFSFNNHYIDIYSSSWGPSDNGKTVEKPGQMAARAMEKGVNEGRNGRGVIYVWASGNGGINGDSCAYDGYASNIFTLSVGSTTESGRVPIYAERCPSTMAVTYSSGSWDEGKVISTDLNNTCTNSHTGTSASAPLAAGILALVLEANPNLTWRDLKHLVAWTSDPFSLLHTVGWYVNGQGMLVHPYFGFGLMDTERLVKAATVWQTVPPKNKCIVKKAGIEGRVFTHDDPLVISVNTRGCQGTASEVKYLEHVEVILSLSHPRRGSVRIFLHSPTRTQTLLAPLRAADLSTRGFVEWPFISVHNWGENPFGVWNVTIESHANSSTVFGSISELRLVFHGTLTEPASTKILREWRRKQTIEALGTTR